MFLQYVFLESKWCAKRLIAANALKVVVVSVRAHMFFQVVWISGTFVAYWAVVRVAPSVCVAMTPQVRFRAKCTAALTAWPAQLQETTSLATADANRAKIRWSCNNDMQIRGQKKKHCRSSSLFTVQFLLENKISDNVDNCNKVVSCVHICCNSLNLACH